jgi:hypothetical protein
MRKANSLKTQKGCVGSIWKSIQVVSLHNIHSKIIKIAAGIAIHVLEGDGDIFRYDNLGTGIGYSLGIRPDRDGFLIPRRDLYPTRDKAGTCTGIFFHRG